MDILKYKDYEGTAELDMDRGVCRGKILFIDDLVTYEADAPKLLQQEFQSAVDDYIETCKAIGKEPQRPFRGQFNVRVPPALHRAATLRAVRSGKSLNDVVVHALDCFLKVRSGFDQHIKVTFEASSETMRTVQSIASEKATWEPVHVH